MKILKGRLKVKPVRQSSLDISLSASNELIAVEKDYEGSIDDRLEHQNQKIEEIKKIV